MASSAYAPYTQAESRSVPSRVNPTLVAAESIGVLSVRVSICRRCSPRTSRPPRAAGRRLRQRPIVTDGLY
jgi:hypothetical protein